MTDKTYTLNEVRELCRDFSDEELIELARLAGIDLNTSDTVLVQIEPEPSK